MAERMHTDLIGPRGEFYLCLQDVGNKDAEIGFLFEGKNISIFTMRSKRDMQSNNLLLIIG